MGNIIGANIIDMAMILPVCSLVSGGSLQISPSTVWVDIPVALFVMAIAIIPTMIAKRFRKWQGYAIVCSYIGYLMYVVAFV